MSLKRSRTIEPRISKEDLDYLYFKYGFYTPKPTDSDKEIMYRAGQKSVYDHFKLIHERQLESSQKDTLHVFTETS